MGNDEQARKDAESALEGLHKGLGVRRTNLHRRLGPALRGILGITSADATNVRERTAQWLEQSLAKLADDRLVQIARVAYNLQPDPQLNGLNYCKRIEVLAARLGSGFSTRTIERLRQEVTQHVQGCLEDPWPRTIPPGRAVARRPEPDDGGMHDALRALHDPRSPAHRAIDCFLAHGVHVPRAPAGGLIAIKAPGPSIWVCAFTRPDWLEAYRRATSAQWASGAHWTLGADLVRTATRTSDPVGILLNPHAGESVKLTKTLSIPPALTTRIGKSLRSADTPTASLDEPTDRFPLRSDS